MSKNVCCYVGLLHLILSCIQCTILYASCTETSCSETATSNCHTPVYQCLSFNRSHHFTCCIVFRPTNFSRILPVHFRKPTVVLPYILFLRVPVLPHKHHDKGHSGKNFAGGLDFLWVFHLNPLSMPIVILNISVFVMFFQSLV